MKLLIEVLLEAYYNLGICTRTDILYAVSKAGTKIKRTQLGRLGRLKNEY